MGPSSSIVDSLNACAKNLVHCPSDSRMKFLTKRHTAVSMVVSDRSRADLTSWVPAIETAEVTLMHIPDALLDPRVAAATSVVGATGLLFALRKLERQLGERTTVLMGT